MATEAAAPTPVEPWRADLDLILSNPPYRGKGGQAKLAQDMGVNPTTVSYWLQPPGSKWYQEPNCDNQTKIAELAAAAQHTQHCRTVGGTDVQQQ